MITFTSSCCGRLFCRLSRIYNTFILLYTPGGIQMHFLDFVGPPYCTPLTKKHNTLPRFFTNPGLPCSKIVIFVHFSQCIRAALLYRIFITPLFRDRISVVHLSRCILMGLVYLHCHPYRSISPSQVVFLLIRTTFLFTSLCSLRAYLLRLV